MSAVLAAARAAPRPAAARLPSDRRRVLGLVVAVLVLVLLCGLSVAVGTRTTPPSSVLQAFTDYDPLSPDQVVVRELRLPRTLLGLLVGAALGLAGVVMQGLTRNPLADPGLLGVNAGAALAVVIGLAVLGVGSTTGQVWLALVGAAVAAVVVYGVASLSRGGASPLTLALAGAAVGALLTALSTAVLLTDSATFAQFRFWQVGALAGRDAGVAAQVAPFLLVGAVLALGLGRSLNTLALGADVARGLGTRVRSVRVVGALAVVLLCGAATAACGPIAFVGLTVPHAARVVAGPDHRWMLPYAMVLAPVLILAADVLGRVIARPGEVQVGVLTALVGAPVFVALVRRRRLAVL
jgi:iron complex transport system permease protein